MQISQIIESEILEIPLRKTVTLKNNKEKNGLTIFTYVRFSCTIVYFELHSKSSLCSRFSAKRSGSSWRKWMDTVPSSDVWVENDDSRSSKT